MTESRTYYGEYSLLRWIDLLLNGNIILPEYQRCFVWNERDLYRLIESLKGGQFIQPVTVGLYERPDGKSVNLLIDGQQRLSSILLAYLGYFPKIEIFESPEENVAIEDDSSLDTSEEELSISPKPIKWTFKELCKSKNKNSIMELRDSLSSDRRYKRLDKELVLSLKEDFWKTHFIGFSYIVPNNRTQKENVRGFFTQLFRNMNYYGEKLSASDSRKSLYYQNAKFTNYFEGKTEKGGDVLCDLKVNQSFEARRIDFIRYLSVLSQKKIGVEKVMEGYSSYSVREDFYADYVAYLLGLGQESRENKFGDFTECEIIKDGVIEKRYVELRDSVERIKPLIKLNDKGAFGSWIDADLWLFGLIYHVVFEGKTLTSDEKLLERLKGEIDEEIARKSEDYQRRSNSIGNLRERIDKSIEIYKGYVL